MSYPQQGNLADFFRPVMVTAHNDTRPLCAIDLDVASAAHGDWVCVRPCTVKQLQFLVSLEAVVGTSTAPTVVFSKYLLPGSASGASTLGTLTIPDATAIGITVYKNVTPVDFAIGQAIHIAWTAAVGGSIAGMGDADVTAELKPEVPGNNSSMLASA